MTAIEGSTGIVLRKHSLVEENFKHTQKAIQASKYGIANSYMRWTRIEQGSSPGLQSLVQDFTAPRKRNMTK